MNEAANPLPHSWQAARWALIAVWLWTAIVSALQAQGLSLELVSLQGRIPPAWHQPVIWSGVGVDLLLGLWMALRPGRLAYLSALGMTVLMTLVGSWVDMSLWLHPLGVLSKNLPIIALLWLLAERASIAPGKGGAT